MAKKCIQVTLMSFTSKTKKAALGVNLGAWKDSLNLKKKKKLLPKNQLCLDKKEEQIITRIL